MTSPRARPGPAGAGDLGGRLYELLGQLCPGALLDASQPVRVLRRSPNKPSSLLTITKVGSDGACVVQVKHQYLMKGNKRESVHVLEVDPAARSVAPRSVQRPDGTALDFRRPDAPKDALAQALRLSVTALEHLLAEGWAQQRDEPLQS